MNWKTKKYTIEQEVHLPRTKVWELLGDTDQLNRMIGLLPVQFSPAKTGKTLFHREALSKAAGIIPMRWQEFPFEWVKNEYYAVSRKYMNGPLSQFYGGIKLADSTTILKDGSYATRVQVFGEFTPANILGFFAIPHVGLGSMKNTLDYLLTFVNSKDQLSKKYQSKLKINVNKLLWAELEKELRLHPVVSDYIPLLRKQLFEMGDNEVVGMAPYKLAEKWKADKTELLRLFLYATKVGILNLNWNIICPNCRVSKETHDTLFDVKELFHCDLCGIDYQANFDQFVELKFTVHPAIRKAIDNTYCIGGPMVTPHIIIQKTIKKGKSELLQVPSADEKLRIRVLKMNHVTNVKMVTQISQKQVELIYTGDGWEKNIIEIPSNHSEIVINNQSSEDIIIAFEQKDWNQNTVTAAKVTTMQEFRDLFSSEVLAPGKQIGIENVTIFFSDLRGSTSLYESIGDASAFNEVRKHFDFLHKWITNNSGCIVKTIGDAVMAVFYSPADAVQAAIDIQNHVKEFNSVQKNGIILKIGLHTGPTIAINSNDKLDYFGRTVNIAARIQDESEGGDIVISKECYERDDVRMIVKESSATAQPFKTLVKGVEGEIELYRIHTSSTVTV